MLDVCVCVVEDTVHSTQDPLFIIIYVLALACCCDLLCVHSLFGHRARAGAHQRLGLLGVLD